MPLAPEAPVWDQWLPGEMPTSSDIAIQSLGLGRPLSPLLRFELWIVSLRAKVPRF